MQNQLEETIDEISKYREEQDEISQKLHTQFEKEIKDKDQTISELKHLIEMQTQKIN